MTVLLSPADNFGVNELLPEMGGFLGDIRFYLCLFLLLVPILMGAMGALRFFRPTECPGCGGGYRAMFGRGSAYAWQVTQWVSGILFMGVGAVLLILAIIVCIVLGGKNVADAVSSVYIWLIVEGAYSLHPVFQDYADLKLFFDIAPDEQLRRIAKRNGEAAKKIFADRWIPLEEKHIRQNRVIERADLILGR